MDFSKLFDQIVDAAELDPRKRMKVAVRAMVEFELQHVPPAIADEIAGSRVEALAKIMVNVLEGRDTRDWWEPLHELRTALREAVDREREHGRLKQVTPESEVERVRGVLEAAAWNPLEIRSVCAMLKAGEKITRIDFFAVATSTRTINREAARAWSRPVTWRNDLSWSEQFTGEAELKRLSDEEHERRNPLPLWSDANRSVQ